MARPSALTPETHSHIVGHIAAGQSLKASAELAGLSESAVTKWGARGRDALDAAWRALEQLPLNEQNAYLALPDTEADPAQGNPRWVDIDTDGHRFWTAEGRAAGAADSPRTQALLMLIPEPEWPYVRFVRSLKRAEAMSEAVLVGGIRRAGLGQDETETSTETQFDAEGNTVSVRTIERRKTSRNWTALAWLLERRLPEQYGRVARTPLLAAGTAEFPTVGSLEDERALGLAAVDELRARRNEGGL